MVNENYLQYLWRKKRLPLHLIKTIQNEQVEFLHVGQYNEFESGPDFSMAKIRIGDLIWVGAIEIHVKSSDWYRHKHHLDTAYNNVILHVVYIHDRKVEVYGRELPVIELKHHIDVKHFLKFNKILVNQNEFFPCKTLFNEKHHADLENMKAQAIQNRLSRKTSEKTCFDIKSDDLFLLKNTAAAFGTAVNTQPFEQLVDSFSINEIINIDEKTKKHILFNFNWKRKGLFSCPQKRLDQFIAFVKVFDFDFHFWELPTSMIMIYFTQQFKKAKINSTFLLNNFLINCVVRFIFWKGKNLGDFELLKKAERLLKIVSAESNHFTRKWKYLGIVPKNAYDSQALLEIYEQLCTRKACLNCDIGKKILSK